MAQQDVIISSSPQGLISLNKRLDVDFYRSVQL